MDKGNQLCPVDEQQQGLHGRTLSGHSMGAARPLAPACAGFHHRK